MQNDDDRLPLPSEDEGNLVEEPRRGMTDDEMVAAEEGVPYDPPSDRVLSSPREGHGGADVAGTAPTSSGELEREDYVQPPQATDVPRDDELQADVIERLRSTDVVAGDRIRVAAAGGRVLLTGEVESIDILDEILGIVGEVPGVEEVVDEIEVTTA